MEDTDGSTETSWGEGTINQEPRALGGQAPSYQAPSKVSRLRHSREKKTDSSVPCIEAGVGRTQPSTTYDPTKIPDAGQTVTIIVSEHKMGK